MRLRGILRKETQEQLPRVIPERSVARSSGSFVDTRAQYFYVAADVVVRTSPSTTRAPL